MAERQARAFLIETRREAGEMARQTLAEAFAAGREEGIARGVAEGREAVRSQAIEDMRDELRRAAAMLVAASERLARARDEVRAEAEAGVVRLAVAIGSKLARRTVACDGAAVALESLREALALAVDRAEVRVLVNPEDAAALGAARETVREEFPEIVRIAFEQDTSVPSGGCRVITASCHIDATLDARAGRIADILVGRDAA
jgi:flagellar biosynthesis/type III secretory pathway protein FliH